MSLTLKEKELVAVGASVAAGCKPCTNHHFKKLRQAGASDQEIRQAISDAVNVCECAKKIMESHGLRLLGVTKDNVHCGRTDKTARIRELVSIASACAVNSTSCLEEHISVAQTVDISYDEIKSVLDMGVFIKGRAASHVDRIAEKIRNVVSSQETPEGVAAMPNGKNTNGISDTGCRQS